MRIADICYRDVFGLKYSTGCPTPYVQYEKSTQRDHHESTTVVFVKIIIKTVVAQVVSCPTQIRSDRSECVVRSWSRRAALRV